MDWKLIIEWIGPVLVVVSLAVPNVMWFRWLNLTGSTIAAIVAAVDEYWPFVFMNGSIALINIFWIWRLTRDRHKADSETVAVVSATVASDDEALTK